MAQTYATPTACMQWSAAKWAIGRQGSHAAMTMYFHTIDGVLVPCPYSYSALCLCSLWRAAPMVVRVRVRDSTSLSLALGEEIVNKTRLLNLAGRNSK